MEGTCLVWLGYDHVSTFGVSLLLSFCTQNPL